MSDTQNQTNKSFSFKWGEKRNTYDSEIVKTRHYDWSLSRYFGGSEEIYSAFKEKYSGATLLDAGCGNGFTATVLFNKALKDFKYTGVDFAPKALEMCEKRFNELDYPGTFLVDNIQIMDLKKQYDVILSSGVLHHTSAPRESYKNLVKHLSPGGTIIFYIYKEKAPVREFVDDYIREYIKDMDDETAWEAMIPLTLLGKKLGELNAEIEIDHDIDVLGIPKGKYDLQRFFYYNFFKAFYRPEYSIEEMNHINFDWYRPLNCFRYSPEEIKEWIKDSGLELVRLNVEESGISVIAQKA